MDESEWKKGIDVQAISPKGAGKYPLSMPWDPKLDMQIRSIVFATVAKKSTRGQPNTW